MLCRCIVAARLIAKQSINISGYHLPVMEPPHVTSASSGSVHLGNTIYVENVPGGWTKMLRRYLENPDNGGGEIVEMKEHGEKHVQVTFANAQGSSFQCCLLS